MASAQVLGTAHGTSVITGDLCPGEKHPQEQDSAVARKVSSRGRKDCFEICSKL